MKTSEYVILAILCLLMILSLVVMFGAQTMQLKYYGMYSFVGLTAIVIILAILYKLKSQIKKLWRNKKSKDQE